MTNKPQFVGEWVKLGDVATYINGYAFKPTDYASEGKPIIRIQDLTGNAYQTNRFAGILDDKYRVGWGDVLISWSASLGVYEWDAEEAWLNQHIFKVQFNKLPINKRFFIHQARYVIAESGSLAHGATMRHLTKKVFANLPFFYPSEHNQDVIARHLDGIQLQIDSAKGMLTRLDDLVKSRFVEMFGTICEPHYPVVEIERLCSCIVDCPHETPKYEGELIHPAIRTSELKGSSIDWSSMRYVSESEYQQRIKRMKPMPGDIVYAREGTYGDAAILPTGYEFCLGQRTMLFRASADVCMPEYLLHALISPDVKRQADELNVGSTVPHVNVRDAKRFKVMCPNLGIQQEFAAFVAQVDKSRFVAQQQIEKLQMLYDSLAQEYFGD